MMLIAGVVFLLGAAVYAYLKRREVLAKGQASGIRQDFVDCLE
jgi:hypothetical protein